MKALNTVVKYLRREPLAIHYKCLGTDTHFRLYSDSAFKKELECGHAIKGTLTMRVSGTRAVDANGLLTSGHGHLIDHVCKRVRNVTRSTWSSELFSLCDAADHGLLLRQIGHEFCHGPLSAQSARMLREGDLASRVAIDIIVDALSVWSSITAAHIKIPAEKSLLSHVQYVRELVDRRVIRYLGWCDTRDMLGGWAH